jgi:hypothetical protein
VTQRSAVRRFAFTAVLCLVSGAAATVVVAWSFVLWSIAHPTGHRTLRHGEAYEILPSAVGEFGRLVDPTVLRPINPFDFIGAASFDGQGPGLHGSHLMVFHTGQAAPPSDAEASIYTAGWPLRALRCEAAWRRGEPEFRWSIQEPRWLARDRSRDCIMQGRPRGLPLLPIPLGFTLDTLFYAAILAGLFVAPSHIRSRLRLRRGLCPACGYDLAGNTTGVCPECGAPAPRPSGTG